jgi:acyl-CoA thioesterase I
MQRDRACLPARVPSYHGRRRPSNITPDVRDAHDRGVYASDGVGRYSHAIRSKRIDLGALMIVAQNLWQNLYLGGRNISACVLGAALWLFASAIAANAAHIDIVALGASNTAGYGVGTAAAYPAQLEALLRAKGYDVTVTNAGVSGDTSAMILARVDSAVPIGTKVVVLQIGIYNDTRTGVSSAENAANIKAAIARVRARGAKVVFVGVASYTAIPKSAYQYDGIHLTEAGHALYAARLLPQVIKEIGGVR